MSRIGKKIIIIPPEVSLSLLPLVETNQEKISIQGKYGKAERKIETQFVKLSYENNQLLVTRKLETKKAREYHGLIRALVQNMVQGVHQQFSRTLLAEGVGYKFQIEGKILILSAGFAHPVKIEIPSDIQVILESPIKLSLRGIDKEKIGFLAATIRAIRPPEPYKGKGILYEGEKIRRKVGKTGK